MRVGQDLQIVLAWVAAVRELDFRDVLLVSSSDVNVTRRAYCVDGSS